jgi:hypothetical protein
MLAILGARPARFLTRPNYPTCCGIGWVCENHPDTMSLVAPCSAGLPYGCNTAEEPDISKLIEDRKPTRITTQEEPKFGCRVILPSLGGRKPPSLFSSGAFVMCIHAGNP